MRSMPSTVPTAPPVSEFDRRVEREIERLRAEEDRLRREQAEATVRSETHVEEKRSRPVEEWAPILERAGLTAVRSVWPDCPVAAHAGNSQRHVDPYQPPSFRAPWLLTDEGIRFPLDVSYQHGREWIVPADYLVCSPIFPLARAGGWGLGAQYALRPKGGGKWKVVDIPGPQSHATPEYVSLAAQPDTVINATGPTRGQVLDLLVRAGLWLNPTNAEHHAAGGVSGEHNVFRIPAVEIFWRFMGEHEFEAPVRVA